MTLLNTEAGDVLRRESADAFIQDLSRTCAFPVPPRAVDVQQTHISIVFLADEIVYKVKKAVTLPFLDFSTLQLRHHFCEEEVRINQPWAPDVYLGVVPITRDAGGLRFEGTGPVIDWAVKMRRLPESATVRSHWQRGQLNRNDLERVARRIAAIHRDSVSISGKHAFEANQSFDRCWTDNWIFARSLNTDIIRPQVMQRLLELSGEWRQRFADTLQQRAVEGMIRDVHGDLRMEHIFLFPQQASPGDIVIIDGIEFNPGLRQIDVAADIAFLTMELSFAGLREMASCVAAEYIRASGDRSGENVLTHFAIYRSAVRAKVAAILAAEPEIPIHDRERAARRSQAHWLWCLSEMETPDKRAALVLVSGLPGTGKSTLARSLADAANFEIIRSDVVRKETFNAETATNNIAAMYSAESTQKIYDECWTRARDRLLSGGRVIVDATFQRDENRQRFLQLAIDCGARAVWLECEAAGEISLARIESRHGDASDADRNVYQQIRRQWEAASEFTNGFRAVIESDKDVEPTRKAACNVLKAHGLLS